MDGAFSSDSILMFISRYQFLALEGALLVALFLHLAFSIIILKQTKEMTQVIEAGISPAIFFVSLLHFFSSVGVIVWILLFF